MIESLPDGAHILDGRPVFVIDGRVYHPIKCRYCGANIAMVPTKRGRMQPRNADGLVHFATCPQYGGRKRRRERQLRLI